MDVLIEKLESRIHSTFDKLAFEVIKHQQEQITQLSRENKKLQNRLNILEYKVNKND